MSRNNALRKGGRACGMMCRMRIGMPSTRRTPRIRAALLNEMDFPGELSVRCSDYQSVGTGGERAEIHSDTDRTVGELYHSLFFPDNPSCGIDKHQSGRHSPHRIGSKEKFDPVMRRIGPHRFKDRQTGVPLLGHTTDLGNASAGQINSERVACRTEDKSHSPVVLPLLGRLELDHDPQRIARTEDDVA